MIPEFDLTGKRAVVTGVSRGIGLAIGQALGEAGARVSGYYFDDTPLDEVMELLRPSSTGEPFVERADASDWDQVNAFADRVVDVFGGIDIWVNNAARLFIRPLLEVNAEDFRSLLSVNLDGYFIGGRVAAERMKDNGWGRIINVSSIAAIQPTSDMTAYSTAKGGINTMTRAMALDLLPYGITVNSVSPGSTETPLNKTAYTPEVRAAYNQRIALGRLAQPREAALPVVFMASDASSYITGSDLICDGGLTINGSVGHARTD